MKPSKNFQPDLRMQGVSQLHYTNAYDSDFALLLRERICVSLVGMMNDAIEVEVNMMTSGKIKQKAETKKIKEEPQASTSQSSSDAKFDMMMRTMEKLMERLYVDERPPVREKNEAQIRNPNFRRPQGPHAPQILQRGQRNQNDQHVRPPFQEKIVVEEYIEQPKDRIDQFGENETKVFVTKEEHDKFLLANTEDPLNEES